MTLVHGVADTAWRAVALEAAGEVAAQRIATARVASTFVSIHTSVDQWVAVVARRAGAGVATGNVGAKRTRSTRTFVLAFVDIFTL